ncbi:MAG: PQQ-dependent sugar dehydrogenase [Phycisphaerales bacterium]
MALPPAGFVAETIGGSWNELAGVVPLDDGRVLAWERAGRIWMMTAEGERIEPPMLDIHEEVGAWRDFGLLGVVPHPNFLQNGHLYLLYVVDRHYLLNFGTPQYDPNADEYYAATIGRVTRYTADASTGFTTVDPATRKILLGEDKFTGIPIVHQSHSVGTLAFSEDGTLLISTGDNASYEVVDTGGQVNDGYVDQALADGILKPKENVGAFRAQLVDCHCGKILRIDPSTGDGVPSNPFYDPAAPRAPKSRVWCLGLRNPFRMTIEPGSGSYNPADGNPGTLIIGDVGWNLLEETDRATGPGQNFGWPVFEGLDYHTVYGKADVANLDAPNPLGGTCNEPYFKFRTLLRQETLDPNPVWLNPCGTLQAESGQTSGMSSSTAYLGFLGSSYLKFDNPTGSWVQWTINVPTTGPWTLGFRYSDRVQPKSLQLAIDGATQADPVTFQPTGAFTEWRVHERTVTLSAGSHTIRITSNGQSGPLVDALAAYPPGQPPLVPSNIPTFVHRRGLADWHHSNGQARVPTYFGQAAALLQIGLPNVPVAGSSFGGQCSIGGPRVHFDSWPKEWRDVVFFGDFSLAWLRAWSISPTGAVTAVQTFDPSFGNVVCIMAHPTDESLWAVRWPGELNRISYKPGGNQLPVVNVTSSQPWGPSPLAVSFDASASYDPDGGTLQFAWDFGDGSTASGAVVQHVFTATSSAPQSFNVVLTATDDAKGMKTKTIVVSANNTPPSVTITSVYDGQLYPMTEKSFYPLEAIITDAEHGPDQLTCSWQQVLHHDTHEHPDPPVDSCSSEAVIKPLGCGKDTFWYEVRLTVTDAAGLATTKTASLYPDCLGWLNCPSDLDHNGVVDAADLAIVLGAWGQFASSPDLDGNGIVDAADLAVLLGAWGQCP